jgi:hypothetical protein
MDDMSDLADFQLQDSSLKLPRCKTLSVEIDCLRSCRKGWNIQWFVPYNSKGSFRNASSLRTICAKTLD